ncbi:MAG: flagellar protein FlaG [Rhodocyclales bacterium]|nr:flagellar protein FlaG [Rhodocyclales bacterium]
MTISPANGPNLDPQVGTRAKDDGARTVPAGTTRPVRAPAGVESSQAAAAAEATRQPTPEQLKAAVSEINKVMQQSNRNLEFSMDDDTHRLVVRLTDTETGELIRQIPSDETLAISRSIGEFQQGFLLKQKA